MRAPLTGADREHNLTGATARTARSAPAIAAEGIFKTYGHVEALRGASLAVSAGEVVVLVGDNGAGKSTLLKIMCGAVAPDAGKVIVGGETVPKGAIVDANQQGIGVVYQDLALAPHLSVLENIYLGHEILRPSWQRFLGALDRHVMAEQTDGALRGLGIELSSVELPVSLLSGGQRQAVAIARAVKWANRVILLDEPTAALGAAQTQIVCDLVRTIADQGVAVMMISHDLARVTQIADRIVVMRQGSVVAEFASHAATVTQIVGAMLGEIPRQPEPTGGRDS